MLRQAGQEGPWWQKGSGRRNCRGSCCRRRCKGNVQVEEGRGGRPSSDHPSAAVGRRLGGGLA